MTDNSFLIEEAYNQEDGVVQHIASAVRDDESGDWIATFAQEWPLLSARLVSWNTGASFIWNR